MMEVRAGHDERQMNTPASRKRDSSDSGVRTDATKKKKGGSSYKPSMVQNKYREVKQWLDRQKGKSDANYQWIVVDEKRDQFLSVWKLHVDLVQAMNAHTKSSKDWDAKLKEYYGAELSRYWSEHTESHDVVGQFVAKFPHDILDELDWAKDLGSSDRSFELVESRASLEDMGQDEHRSERTQGGRDEGQDFTNVGQWATGALRSSPPSDAFGRVIAGESNPYFKAQLQALRDLTANYETLAKVGFQLLISIEKKSEGSSGESPHRNKLLGGPGSRKLRSTAMDIIPELVVRQSSYKDLWKEGGLSGYAVIASQVESEQCNGLNASATVEAALQRIRTDVSGTVQAWIANRIAVDFPLYKERSSVEKQTAFQAAVLASLSRDPEWQNAKATASQRHLSDIDVLNNSMVLLAFTFQSGLHHHVMKEVFEGKWTFSRSIAALVVVALRRALKGKFLSGKNFNAKAMVEELQNLLCLPGGDPKGKGEVDDEGENGLSAYFDRLERDHACPDDE